MQKIKYILVVVVFGLLQVFICGVSEETALIKLYRKCVFQYRYYNGGFVYDKCFNVRDAGSISITAGEGSKLVTFPHLHCRGQPSEESISGIHGVPNSERLYGRTFSLIVTKKQHPYRIRCMENSSHGDSCFENAMPVNCNNV
ncbi:hypothetical protein AYI70_g11317 [Smittium culicis]|uniref:Uncharacterized protein n=1 Tax=Smittium culicis TaxID=133412 RepID=A0A1R1X2E4_9FUNG|nr:hypothetical protein AYI70_g11317 [Smittium culicis]